MIDVRFKKSNSSSGSTTTTTTEPTTTLATPGVEDCGDGVGCFYDNWGSVVKYSMTEDGLDIQFEISCPLDDSGWCSVGFSDTGLMVSYTNTAPSL